MSTVVLNRVTKGYGGAAVLREFSLDVRAGELVSLLGPSGCGKTTTLNLIAGFMPADSGEIIIGGQSVERLPAHKRNTAMVFQGYALFPHLTVAGNVAFGLEVRKVDPRTIRERVGRALELVRLGPLADRYPRQLSGGQQQRVAIARAIAVDPAVLLLDEPLSNLDAKLREEMRAEIRSTQRTVGITTLYVTHDQEEALAISDRVVVMNGGRIEQLGTPQEIYRRPASPFVASFIGAANLLAVTVRDAIQGVLTVVTNDGLELQVRHEAAVPHGTAGVVAIRPEDVAFSPQAAPANQIEARVEDVAFLGPVTLHTLRAGEYRIRVRGVGVHAPGTIVTAYLPADRCLFIADAAAP